MKPLLAICCSAFLFSLPYPGEVFAQSLAEQGMAGAVGVGALYGATKRLNNSGEDAAIVKVLQQQGYTNVASVPSAPSQYTAFHPSMGPVLLNINPSTGQVISVAPR